MKRILSAAAVMLIAAGCGRTQADEFRRGLPTREMVEVKTPGNESQGVRNTESPLVTRDQGDRSGSYQLTRGATATINGGTLWVLGLVKAITDHRPTTVEEDRAIWGPANGGDPLDPHIYKLTVQRTGEGAFSYAFEAKDKNLGDDAFVVVLSGTHAAAETEGYGSGSFLIDWDAVQTLPEHGNEVGTASVEYARAEDTGVVTVAAQFDDVRDGNGGTADFSYRYSRTPAQGGTFEFMTNEDIHDQVALSSPEKLTVKSRFNEAGEGRADYEVSGGDLGDATHTGNECWDTAFNSQYLAASWAPEAGYGTVATGCSADFQEADYSSL